MPEPAWKGFERRVATILGGKRRGAGTSEAGEGKCDVIVPGMAPELALLGRPSFSDLLSKARQAEKNAQPGQLPIAIVKRKRDHDDNALVVMRLEEWTKWYVK